MLSLENLSAAVSRPRELSQLLCVALTVADETGISLLPLPRGPRRRLIVTLCSKSRYEEIQKSS